MMCLLFIWALVNIFGLMGITVASCSETDFDLYNLLFFPIFIGALREKLNKIGTVLVTVLFSLLFMPALILYFVGLCVVALGSVLVKCFIWLFRRRD